MPGATFAGTGNSGLAVLSPSRGEEGRGVVLGEASVPSTPTRNEDLLSPDFSSTGVEESEKEETLVRLAASED
jgi:hypothetical protein